MYRDIGSLASREGSCDMAQGRALARCDTTLAGAALGHDTAITPCDTAMEACDTHGTTRRGARHDAQWRTHERDDTTAWAAIQQGASATTPPGLPTIRPGVRAPGRACARLGVPSWASFGARAPGLVFDLVFRLDIVSESPFGLGS